jgi:hypothetical protein
MPLTLAGPTRLGLGLWNSIPATLLVEITVFLLAVRSYALTTRANDRTGRGAFLSLVAFLMFVYLGSAFGPPPPSGAAVAWTAQAIWLLVAWGYWVERHRSLRP